VGAICHSRGPILLEPRKDPRRMNGRKLEANDSKGGLKVNEHRIVN
jgi:hypothetical protein